MGMIFFIIGLLTFFVTPIPTFASHTRTSIESFQNELSERQEIRVRRRVTPTIAQKTPTPTPTPTPTIPVSLSNNDKQTYMMNKINEYRASKGLSSVKTDSYTCNFAKVRAAEITTSFNHSGFRDRINNKSLPYPSYHMITENIALNSDYKRVVDAWIGSSGHAANMRADTPYVCVEFSGNYYAYEGWKP